MSLLVLMMVQAIGEMARSFGGEVRGYVVEVLSAMIPLLNSNGLEARLLDNLSITIGRLVLACPNVLAPFLPQFCRVCTMDVVVAFMTVLLMQPWCFYLSRYPEDEEKAHAFRGLCLMGQANPQAVIDSFAEVCSAIASWQNPPQELGNMFGQLLHQFKANLAPQNQWEPLFHKCPTDVQALLQRLYRLEIYRKQDYIEYRPPPQHSSRKRSMSADELGISMMSLVIRIPS